MANDADVSCDGNALECTVHHSRWHTEAAQQFATVCEHVWLSGREHVHDGQGVRRQRGDIEEPMCGLVSCVCDGNAPPEPYEFLGRLV
jgi:hypothetical protein